MEFSIKHNNNEFNNQYWEPGDRLYLNLINKERYRSIISLNDHKGNKRFSVHSGSDNIDFNVIIPKTYTSSVWDLIISQNNDTERIAIEIIGLKELDKLARKETRDPVEEESKEEENKEEESKEEENKEEESKEEENKEEEDVSINISKMSMKKIKIMLHELENDEQLSNILAIDLNEEQLKDLKIPIAEIESIDIKYYNSLKDAGIDDIAQILVYKPIEIKQIADAPMDEIKAWYSDLYIIYKKKNHRLKKEYRIIRSFNDAKDEELSKIRGTSKAEDTIDVLSGVSDDAKVKLSEMGIINVLDILEYPLDDLTKIEVDHEKPLLWKTWLANAKSHFGIH